MRRVTFREVVGETVKTLRGALTQGQFGELTGVAQSSISALERGSRSVRGDHLEAILEAKKVDAVSLFGLMKAIADGLHAKTVTGVAPKPASARFVPLTVGGKTGMIDENLAELICREMSATHGAAAKSEPPARSSKSTPRHSADKRSRR